MSPGEWVQLGAVAVTVLGLIIRIESSRIMHDREILKLSDAVKSLMAQGNHPDHGGVVLAVRMRNLESRQDREMSALNARISEVLDTVRQIDSRL